MTTQHYCVHLNSERHVDIDLTTTQPLYQIIADLAVQSGLPSHDRNGREIPYTLYINPKRRLSTELTLQQIRYDGGGELLLADWLAPWWESADSPPSPGPAIVLPPLPILIAVVSIALIGLSAIFLQRVLSQPGGTRLSTPSAKATEHPSATTMLVVAAPTISRAPTIAPTAAEAPTIAPSEIQTIAPTIDLSTAEVPSGESTATASIENTPTIPALRTVQTLHILPEHRNRNSRLFFRQDNDFGAYLWVEPGMQSKVPATNGVIVISNGDTLEILDESVPEVYQIRLVTNTIDASDPKVVGATGWIARWLVDKEVPLAPRPTPIPTRPSTRLLRIPNLRGLDVGVAEQQLRSRGFTGSIARSALPPNQAGGLCKGRVSFTSPPAGTEINPSRSIRLFYRDWRDNQPDPLGC